VAAAKKKRLEDELVEKKRKAKEATAQFNDLAIGKVVRADNLVFCEMLILMSCRLP
jgi:hypothetical protein